MSGNPSDDSSSDVTPEDGDGRTRIGAAILWRTVTRNARRLTSGSLLICGHQLCEAMVPVLIGVLVDRAVKPGDATQLVIWIGVLAALFAALTSCYRFGARHLMRAIATEGHQLRIDLAARILDPRRLRTSQRSGELLSIASTDADNVSYLLDYIPRIAGAVTAIVVCAAVLLTIDVPLGLAVLIGTPVILFALQFGGPVITRRVAEQQEAAGEATAMSADLVAGLRPLRGIGAEHAAAARYRTVSRDALRASIRAARAQGVYLGFSSVLSSVLAVGIAVLAGWLALRGSITVGQLITVIGLAQFLLEPFGTLAEAPSWIAEARASAERVGWIEDATFALTPGAATLDGAAPHGIALDRVGYGGLGDISLTVAPGQFVGVVTTRSSDAEALVGVLSGRVAREEYTGEIRLSGVPLEDLDLDEARRALLVEPHRADLFTGSVRSNLGGERDPEALAGALHASNAVDVIDAHPDGLDHIVTERGSSLSGGQRQRLTLARALLRAAPVLVLHEPTTAVDAVTEDAVAQGIASLRHGPDAEGFATVIVTCSPALLAVSDRVVLIDDGRVMLEGPHEDLMLRPEYRSAVLR
ncbi:ABC transporter ATP-binding protein [Arthrobacter sp. SLBN-53]|uniref:ABC transporter ATP-binding protein n=1 Tax=Arthrobacter sp. SLBN-53 TaxID=2768412 RepID=UPI00116EA974|nr:ABC transporter ATP-binding protein [Arthrobacter sp. SLBN-53]TQK31332.1 putative ABC transport system ATP-binding protein [Arthrobacter sp. SLBN-53]